MLTPQVPLGQEGGPVALVGKGSCLAVLHLQQSSSEKWGWTDRLQSSARGLGSNFPLCTSVLQSTRRRAEVNPQLSSKDLGLDTPLPDTWSGP